GHPAGVAGSRNGRRQPGARPETWRTWPRCDWRARTALTGWSSSSPTGCRAQGLDVLSGCGGSHTRSAACQQLAKTGTNRMDRTTQTGHADFADLDVRDAAEHWSTMSCSQGAKWLAVHTVEI